MVDQRRGSELERLRPASVESTAAGLIAARLAATVASLRVCDILARSPARQGVASTISARTPGRAAAPEHGERERLAEAIGEHLLVELAERVERLRAERRAVAGGPPAPGW